MILDAAGRTDVGRARRVNQDAFLAASPLYVVADGMGGHSAGEVASALALETFRSRLRTSAPTRATVVEAVRAANEAVRERARAEPTMDGMGTTLTGLVEGVIDGEACLIAFSVGDSRLYRLRGRELLQVSLDHSVTAELVRAGQLTSREADTDHRQHIITRAVGVAADIEVDSWLLTPWEGDVYLLCSDGLTNELDAANVLQLLAEAASADEACGQLISAALTAGGRDNVSTVVVRVQSLAAGAAQDETVPGAAVRQRVAQLYPERSA